MQIDAAQYCAKFDNSTRYWKNNEPIVFSRGNGSFIYDTHDNEYLDLNNGWSSTSFGHNNSELNDVVIEQVQTLDLTPNMLSDKRVLLSKELALISKIPDAQAYIDTSGSLAIELAIKLAISFTQKTKVVCFEGGFHGRSIGALSVTGGDILRKHKIDLPDWGVRLPYATCSYCPAGKTKETCSVDCQTQLELLLQEDTDIAAILVEPALGAGGYVFPDDRFLKKLSLLAKKHNILLIVDEIQMGLGRCGEMLLHQRSGITPDMVVMGKALSGGSFPIGAVVAKQDVMSSLDPGVHTGSYAGAPIGCALGQKVLEMLQRPEFMLNVQRKGNIFASVIQNVREKYPNVISVVEQQGLAIAVEIAGGPEQKEKIRFGLMSEGVFALGRGENSNRICMAPSLIMEDELIHDFGRRLEATISKVTKDG